MNIRKKVENLTLKHIFHNQLGSKKKYFFRTFLPFLPFIVSLLYRE